MLSSISGRPLKEDSLKSNSEEIGLWIRMRFLSCPTAQNLFSCTSYINFQWINKNFFSALVCFLGNRVWPALVLLLMSGHPKDNMDWADCRIGHRVVDVGEHRHLSPIFINTAHSALTGIAHFALMDDCVWATGPVCCCLFATRVSNT